MAYERTFRQRVYDAQKALSSLEKELQACGESPSMTGLIARVRRHLHRLWQGVNQLEPKNSIDQTRPRAPETESTAGA